MLPSAPCVRFRTPLPFSVLHKRQREIDQIKSRRTKNARANDARRKAVLGAFMVAQFRHRPALHAELAPDLRAHLASHPRPEMGSIPAECRILR
jgi:hypothetical protein